jgi:hypothetical protein
MSNSRGSARILKLFGSSMIIGLMLFAAQPVAAQNNWLDWTRFGSNNYPAHISAIYFPRGNLTMDANRSIKWGNWTVSFGAVTPVASYDFLVDEQAARNTIYVALLRCKNPAAGEYDCTMRLNYVRYDDNKLIVQCTVETKATRSYEFDIACPSRLLRTD